MYKNIFIFLDFKTFDLKRFSIDNNRLKNIIKINTGKKDFFF